jgi:hypothetical protein
MELEIIAWVWAIALNDWLATSFERINAHPSITWKYSWSPTALKRLENCFEELTLSI